MECVAPALNFIGALPFDRWVIVKNCSSIQSMNDLVGEYNVRNPENRVKVSVENADNGSIKVKRLDKCPKCKGTGYA